MNPLDKSFLLSKLLGCFPFSLNDGRTKVDRKLLGFSLFLKLVFTPQPILNVFQASFIMSRTKVHLTTGTVSFILAVIFSSVSFASYFRNRKKLDLILRNYEEADEQFKKLGQKPNSKVNLRFDYFMIVLILFLPCIRVYVTPRMTWYMVYQLVYLVHVMGSLYMLIQPFVRIVGNLNARMNKVKSVLLYICNTVSVKEKDRKLESVIRLYDLLCSTCDVLNEIFSQNLLFVTFMVFFMITTYVYYSMTNVFGSYFVAIIQGIVASYYSIIICLISIYSDRITEEVL